MSLDPLDSVPVEAWSALKAERDALKETLDGLVGWIDAWRDRVDGHPDEDRRRWRAGFTDTTPELVRARAVLHAQQEEAGHD